MRLSKSAIKLLGFMGDYYSYIGYTDLEKKSCEEFKKFDDCAFRALLSAGLLDELQDGEELSQISNEKIFHTQYRVNDAGRAYLEEMRENTWEEVRAWIAIVLSVASLAISIIAICLR